MTQKQQHVLRAILLMSIAVILFAIVDTLSKYLTGAYPVTQILWTRYVFHTLLMVVAIVPRHGLALFKTSRPGIQILRGILLAAAALFFVAAIKYMPLAEATAIQFLAPLLVTLLAVVFLKEKVDTARWLAVLAGFAGVLIIIRPGSGIFTWFSIMLLGTAILFASYQVLTRRYAGLESPYSLIFYPGLLGVTLLAPTLPFAWATPHDLADLGWLALAGMLYGSGHLILILAYKQAPASRLAAFSYMQLVWVTLGGYIVFDTFPDNGSLTGIAILVTSGIYLATHQHLQDRRQSQ